MTRTFAQNLAEEMARQQLNCAELARRAGLSPSHLTRLLSSRPETARAPTWSVLVRLSKALGLPQAWLVRETAHEALADERAQAGIEAGRLVVHARAERAAMVAKADALEALLVVERARVLDLERIVGQLRAELAAAQARVLVEDGGAQTAASAGEPAGPRRRTPR